MLRMTKAEQHEYAPWRARELARTGRRPNVFVNNGGAGMLQWICTR